MRQFTQPSQPLLPPTSASQWMTPAFRKTIKLFSFFVLATTFFQALLASDMNYISNFLTKFSSLWFLDIFSLLPESPFYSLTVIGVNFVLNISILPLFPLACSCPSRLFPTWFQCNIYIDSPPLYFAQAPATTCQTWDVHASVPLIILIHLFFHFSLWKSQNGDI